MSSRGHGLVTQLGWQLRTGLWSEAAGPSPRAVAIMNEEDWSELLLGAVLALPLRSAISSPLLE